MFWPELNWPDRGRVAVRLAWNNLRTWYWEFRIFLSLKYWAVLGYLAGLLADAAAAFEENEL